MKVRYQADADLDQRIILATHRHEPLIDFQLAAAAASGVGLTGLHDECVLAIAAEEGRILVTHDRRTMLRYFAQFITTNVSPSVISEIGGIYGRYHEALDHNVFPRLRDLCHQYDHPRRRAYPEGDHAASLLVVHVLDRAAHPRGARPATRPTGGCRVGSESR